MRLTASWPFGLLGGDRGWLGRHRSSNPYNPYIHGSRFITSFRRSSPFFSKNKIKSNEKYISMVIPKRERNKPLQYPFKHFPHIIFT